MRFFTLQLDGDDLSQRLEAVKGLLGRVQERLQERYPVGEGYAHELRWVPGDRWQFELLVQRGSGWGLRLSLGQDDGRQDLRELQVAALQGSRLVGRVGQAALVAASLVGLVVAAGALINAGSFNLRGGLIVGLMAAVPALVVGVLGLVPLHLWMTRKLGPELHALGALVQETWDAAPLPGARLKTRRHPMIAPLVLSGVMAAGLIGSGVAFQRADLATEVGTVMLSVLGMIGFGLFLLTGIGQAIGAAAGVTEGPGVFGGAGDAQALPEGGLPDLEAALAGIDGLELIAS